MLISRLHIPTLNMLWQTKKNNCDKHLCRNNTFSVTFKLKAYKLFLTIYAFYVKLDATAARFIPKAIATIASVDVMGAPASFYLILEIFRCSLALWRTAGSCALIQEKQSSAPWDSMKAPKGFSAQNLRSFFLIKLNVKVLLMLRAKLSASTATSTFLPRCSRHSERWWYSAEAVHSKVSLSVRQYNTNKRR